MTVIRVPNMQCEKCAGRIESALTEAGLDFSVSLQEKTVTVNGCENCVAKAKKKLSELGFEAE